jgi:hypothetical protein
MMALTTLTKMALMQSTTEINGSSHLIVCFFFSLLSPRVEALKRCELRWKQQETRSTIEIGRLGRRLVSRDRLFEKERAGGVQQTSQIYHQIHRLMRIGFT